MLDRSVAKAQHEAERDADRAAMPKPMPTRCSDDSTFQPMPWSFGPFE